MPRSIQFSKHGGNGLKEGLHLMGGYIPND